MNKFVVGVANLYDNELNLTLVLADGWRDAVDQVLSGIITEDTKTLDDAIAAAFDCEYLLNVLEIK